MKASLRAIRLHESPGAALLPVTALAFGFLAGCDRGGGSPASSVELTGNPALQEVVALQVDREGRALVRLLGEDDPAVRARAAFALGSVRDQTAAAALIEGLSDGVAAVRAEAAFALGQLPQLSQQVESALLEAVEAEADPTARTRLVEALGRVGRAPASEWLARLPPSDSAGVEGTLALARTLARGAATAGAVDALLARLVDPDARVREVAAWGLANALREAMWAGKRAIVYEALDGYERADPAAVQLLRALARIADPAGKERIRDWLAASPDWRVRAAAAEALGAAPAPPDRAALLEALEDASPHVRLASATALSGSRLEPPELDRVARWVQAHPEDHHTGGALMGLLGSGGRGSLVVDWLRSLPPDEAVGWRAGIDASALLPGDVVTRVLADASRSTSPAIAGAAARALALRWATRDVEAALHPLYYEAFVRALRAREPALVPVLANLLSESSFRALGSDSVLADARALAGLPPAPFAELDWGFLRGLGPSPRLVLETERGTVTLELFPDEAPLTVQTVARLAREGRYDGVPFHRVLPNFMAQGGDVVRGDGLGQPGFRIPSELTHHRYVRGTAGMARTEKDTENAQFFITQSIQPHLDGSYTAFGRVVEGLDVVDAILENDRVVRARIEVSSEAPPSEG